MTEDPPVQLDLGFVLSRIRRWVLLFLFLLILVSGIGVVVALTLPTVYRAEALLVVESEQIPDDLAASTVQTNAREQLQIIEKRVLSREVLVRMADRLGIYAAEGRAGAEQMSSGEVVEDLRMRIRMMPSDSGTAGAPAETDALLVRVMFDSPDADVAARVANELVTQILEVDVATRIQIARQTQEFFEQEVARLEKDLSARSMEIQGFKEENIEALPDSLVFRREDLAMIEARMVQLERDRRILLDQIDRIDRLTGGLAPAPGDAGEEAADAPISGRVTTRDVRRSDLVTELSYVDQEREQLQGRAEGLRATIAETPRVAIRLEALERDYANVRSQYDLAIANLAKAEIGELIESLAKGRRISVIEQAVRPDRPFSPDRPKVALIGVLAGLLIAGGVVLALEMLRGVIRRPQDIESVIGAQMIVTLPHVRTRREVMLGRAVWALVFLVVAGAGALTWQNRAQIDRFQTLVIEKIRGLLPTDSAGGA